MRSGIPNTATETYERNYIFDDISAGFTGTERDFTLTSAGSTVTGIENDNAIILINDVFQGPGRGSDYELEESGSTGITTISFTGTASSIASDVNTSNLPVGGVIVSVGSTEGFGYQPLVAAGGTAVVSTGGTISSVGQRKEDLLVNSLVERVIKDNIEEVIIATSATVEGQTTAHYLQDSLKKTNVKVSKLAQGLPVGGEIESLDDGTLYSAFKNRTGIKKNSG